MCGVRLWAEPCRWEEIDAQAAGGNGASMPSKVRPLFPGCRFLLREAGMGARGWRAHAGAGLVGSSGGSRPVKERTSWEEEGWRKAWPVRVSVWGKWRYAD